MTQGQTKPDYLRDGFELMDRDLRFLLECFSEVLSELGYDDLARHLPWLGQVDGSAQAPWRLGLAYSVAFQLLNMVEEHAAGVIRAGPGVCEGGGAEVRAWGLQFARREKADVDEKAILATMRREW